MGENLVSTVKGPVVDEKTAERLRRMSLAALQFALRNEEHTEQELRGTVAVTSASDDAVPASKSRINRHLIQIGFSAIFKAENGEETIFEGVCQISRSRPPNQAEYWDGATVTIGDGQALPAQCLMLEMEEGLEQRIDTPPKFIVVGRI